ncbi:MAG TPA: hypothetical protein VF054_15455 [Micromonosporaceae bacterium]
MTSLDELAQRADTAGAALAEASATLGRLDPGARSFGGDGPGRLGELGRALHAVFATALDAREREAAAHGARLADVASALRLVTAGYRDVDDAAHDRHRIGEN